MRNPEIRLAFGIAWGIISLVVLLVLVLPFAVPGEVITAALPPCEWQVRYQEPCPLCGMTTAFLRISDGDLRGATAANRFSLCLYSLFVANELAATAVLFQFVGRRRWQMSE